MWFPTPPSLGGGGKWVENFGGVEKHLKIRKRVKVSLHFYFFLLKSSEIDCEFFCDVFSSRMFYIFHLFSTYREFSIWEISDAENARVIIFTDSVLSIGEDKIKCGKLSFLTHINPRNISISHGSKTDKYELFIIWSPTALYHSCTYKIDNFFFD